MIKKVSFNDRLGSIDANRRQKMAESVSGKPHTKRGWRSPFRIIAIIIVIGILTAGGFFGYKAYSLSSKVFVGDDNTSLFDQLKLLADSDKVVLKGEEQGRINILLLGIGGEGYSGAQLTDTNILFSIKPDTKQISMVSVPRDLYVRIPGYGYNKLNAAHAFAEQAQEGTGPDAAVTVISDITGQEIHYWARVDFTGFMRIIDEVGGIDVPIETGFYDYLHQNRFEAGVEHMDGHRALEYVRARYVQGPEGSDFARARRQQQVLGLVRDKVVASGRAADITAITGILEALSDNIRTSLQPAEIKHLYDLAKDVPDENMLTQVIDGASGLVRSDRVPLGGVDASILRATDPTYGAIRKMIATVFDAAAAEEEAATIEVQNGAGVTGAAKKTADQFVFDAVLVTDADRKDFETSVIYDYTEGKKPNSLQKIEEELGVKASPLPSDEESRSKIRKSDDADFVIIVGRDYAEKL